MADPRDQTITIYETPNCVQCRTTKRYLDKIGVPYTVAPLEEPWISALKERGHTTAPGVVIRTAMRAIVDMWGGYDPARLRRHAPYINGSSMKENE